MRLSIRHPGDFAHVHERRPFGETTATCDWKREFSAETSNRLIALLDQMIAEESVICRARFRLNDEQHQARRIAINAVRGSQGVNTELPFQPDEQCLLHESSGRNNWQKMRLVGDHDEFVLIDHRLVERKAGLIKDAAVVEDLLMRREARFRRDRRAIVVGDIALQHATRPLTAADRRKTRGQKIQSRRPCTYR